MVIVFSDSATLGVIETIAASGMLVSSLAIGLFPLKRNYAPIRAFSLFLTGLFMVLFGLRENLFLIGLGDIRIDIQQKGDIGAKSSLLAEQLGRDGDVARYSLLTTRAYKAETGEGTGINLKVELGDHTEFPVLYTRGKAPEGPQYIALSSLEAEELGLAPGDHLTLFIRGKSAPWKKPIPMPR